MHGKGLNGIATLSALAVMILGFGALGLAGDEEAREIQVKRVHKVVIDCDEAEGEGCEQEDAECAETWHRRSIAVPAQWRRQSSRYPETESAALPKTCR